MEGAATVKTVNTVFGCFTKDGSGKKIEKWISEISISISVSILRDVNWNEIGKQISEISNSFGLCCASKL